MQCFLNKPTMLYWYDLTSAQQTSWQINTQRDLHDKLLTPRFLARIKWNNLWKNGFHGVLTKSLKLHLLNGLCRSDFYCQGMSSRRNHMLSFAEVAQSTRKIIQFKKLKVYQDNLNSFLFTVFPKLELGLWQMLKKGREKKTVTTEPLQHAHLTVHEEDKEAPLSFTQTAPHS